MNRRRLTTVQWMICIIASIGFAFDIYELLMLPLIIRPALLELVNARPGTPEFEFWVGRLFFVPALVGGVFGLIGGYLTDLLGRRRVLTWSIFLYAFSACASGFSTSVEMLLVLRCLTFAGVCVEFVAAVAWLAELFPEHRQREAVLGYTQAFSSAGGMLVTVANLAAVQYAPALVSGLQNWLPTSFYEHDPAWRLTLMSGVIPALPLMVIRPFLPESPQWAAKKAAGTLSRPSFGELFSPGLWKTTVVTTIMFACSYGIAFGTLQHMPRIVPSVPEVVAEAQQSEGPERRRIEQHHAGKVNLYQEVGGLAGRLLLAYLAVRILSRRLLIRIFQVPGLVVIPIVYLIFTQQSLTLLKGGMFIAGLLTVAQFSFWGNYIPRVFPLHLRGTGESFAANVGGRILGTSAALLTTWLTTKMPGNSLALAATTVGISAFGVGLICSFWLPEPPSETLVDDDLPQGTAPAAAR